MASMVESAYAQMCVQWDNDGKHRCRYTEKNEDGTHTLIHGEKGKVLVESDHNPEGNHL